MLNVPTAFVIGAGAGIDLGMPVGSSLSKSIADKLNIYFEWGHEKKSGDGDIISAIRKYAVENKEDANDWYAAGRSIKNGIFHTRSIDDYCHSHKDNEKIRLCAKLGIAKTILSKERSSYLHVSNAVSRRFNNPEKVGDAWISGFFRALFSEVVVSQNPESIFRNLAIVDFNYHRCIEHYLYHALQDLLIPDQKAAKLINERLEIYHPYGTLGCLPWQNGYSKIEFGGTEHYAPDYLALAMQIKTYDERMEDMDMLAKIRGVLAKAERVVFLGFHFHKQNMILLGGDQKDGPDCEVLATTLERSQADVGIIKQRIRTALLGKGVRGFTDWEQRNLDCGGLFKEFGTLLSA